jgi:type I restriction enzyme S subunit
LYVIADLIGNLLRHCRLRPAISFAWAASLGVYIWEGGDAWLNQHIFKVLPKPVIIKEYLYYLLQAKIHDLYTKTHGSGMVHITRAIFMSESVLLPPIKEQQRIVSAIKAYYALLDKVAASLN